MELANIEKLLEKYLNAETTLAEENDLKNYFLSDNVAPHLLEYKSLFEYFSISKSERYTKTIHLKSQKKKWKWLSVAASLVLIVSVYSIKQANDRRIAEKAYADTQKAFNLLSTNLNKGTVAIGGQLKNIETVERKIFKQQH
ncbi:hypothetical protein [Lutibacter sp.]